MRRLAILRTGTTAEPVRRIHGDYDRWFIDGLPQGRFAIEVSDVTGGRIPSLGDVAGVIVTGATSAAYDHEPWMDSLSGLLARAESIGVPVLCVCLGAQLLAQARGGRIVRNPEGWEIGAVDIDLTPAAAEDPLLSGLPRRIRVLATHEDSIEELPPGATRLAGNASTPVQAFRAAPGLWGLQFHPELRPDVLARLIELRREALTLDARRQKRSDPDGHVDRLLEELARREPCEGLSILRRFADLCDDGR